MVHGASRFRIVVVATIALFVVGTKTSRAGIVYQLPSNDVTSSAASEFDDLSRTIFELNEATRSFEKHDLEACLKQLEKAAKAHPDLPPAQALLAKLALSRNQIRLVGPALETAVAQAPDHPEIYILFGNLALLENRATDAALHFEKATTLAATRNWTTDQRDRFDVLCQQGYALLAERRCRLEDRPESSGSVAGKRAVECACAATVGTSTFHACSARRGLQRTTDGRPAGRHTRAS